MRCVQCQHEAPAGAAFCPRCGAELAPTCPRCAAPVAAGHRFCTRCGHRLEPPAAPDGERKLVTVLFADLKGSMELMAERDPEEARRLLDPVLQLMMDAVHRHEGTVNQVMGDGIMALFGAPLAHEDHAARACHAALDMQAAVRRYADEVGRADGVAVAVRVGLNSGEVVVRAVESDLQMDYTAVGQTTHLAARMEQMAEAGSILATGATYRLAEGYVEARPLGLRGVRGLARPVETYEVLGFGAARGRFDVAARRGLTRFVGRQAQLDQLRGVLAVAAGGHGQLVAVVGEAGAGKSRLVAELTAALPDGWRVLHGRPVAQGRSIAYAAVMELLRSYVGIDGRDDAAAIRRKAHARTAALDAALEPAVDAVVNLLAPSAQDSAWDLLDPAQRRARIVDALRALLLRESAVQPLLVVVEDLHWIDAETQECLEALVDGLAAAPLVLLVDYRPEYRHAWGGRSYYTQVRVDPLTSDTATELLDALLGTDPGLTPLKRTLIARTEGNPFFLEESVRALVESAALVGEPGAHRLDRPHAALVVPPTVQAVLAARIDRLRPEDKALLQMAAVVGKDFGLAVLRAVAGTPEPQLREALGRLQAAEFVYQARAFPELEYTFKHALTHAVAYEGLLTERRRELHAAALAALEQLHAGRLAAAAETLAHHAVRAEAWPRAVDHLRAAAANAFERGSLGDTLARLEEALALTARLQATPDDARRTLDVRLDLHAPLLLLGQSARLLALHDETHAIARAAGDRLRLGRVLYRMSSARWLAARYGEGRDLAREALDTAADDPEVRIFATLYVGIHAFLTARFDEAIEHFLRIVEGPDAPLSRRRFGSASPAYVVANNFLVWALASVGQFDRALEHGRRAVEAVDLAETPLYQAPAYAFYSMPLTYRGRHDEALRYAGTAVRAAESQRMLSWLPATASMLGWTMVAAGRADEGLPYLERAVTFHESLGIDCFLSFFFTRWAEGLLLAGRPEEAEAAARRATDLAAKFGERAVEAEALAILAAVVEARTPGDAGRAEGLYATALSTAEALGMRPLVAQTRVRRAELRQRRGERDRAADDLAVAVAMLEEMDMRSWLARAQAVLSPRGAAVR